MRIRIDVAIHDVIALRKHQFFDANVWVWRTIAILCLIVLISAIAFFFFLQGGLQLGQPAPLVWFLPGTSLIVLVGWYFVVRHTAASIVEWQTRKNMNGAAGRMALGWHEMELVDGFLVVETELFSCRMDLRTIADLTTNGRHAFVLLASGQSFVIPLTHFPEGEIRSFVAELRDAWENRHSGRPKEIGTVLLAAGDEYIEELRNAFR
jgi:hypothetical protein